MKKGLSAAALTMAVMAMCESGWDNPSTKKVIEKPKKECPVCHKLHNGKHYCCKPECYKLLVEKQRNKK